MGERELLVGAVALIAYGLASKWFEAHSVTPAMAMVAVGFALAVTSAEPFLLTDVGGPILKTAEYTLALMLFWDAARIDLRVLRRGLGLPARLLGIGMPVMVLLGLGLVVLLVPGVGLVGAGLIAVMLAPTDAALGEAVVSDERVPVAIRQSLDVESGLNDGLAVPLFLVLVDLSLNPGSAKFGLVLSEFVVQVGVGLAVGLAVGGVGGLLLAACARRDLVLHAWGDVVVALMAGSCFLVADTVGASGFVAAFSGGLAFGAVAGTAGRRNLALTGVAATLISGLSFLAFGAVLVPKALPVASPAVWVFAIASLALLRPLSVLVATAGMRLAPTTVAFLGWFGPRGLATIVFALLLAEARAPGFRVVVTVATIGVLVSVFAHGLSARPLAGAYARWARGHRERSLEPVGPDVVPIVGRFATLITVSSRRDTREEG